MPVLGGGPKTMPERDLLVAVRDYRDAAAREELITRYLPLVRSLARRFASRGQPVEDRRADGSVIRP